MWKKESRKPVEVYSTLHEGSLDMQFHIILPYCGYLTHVEENASSQYANLQISTMMEAFTIFLQEMLGKGMVSVHWDDLLKIMASCDSGGRPFQKTRCFYN